MVQEGKPIRGASLSIEICLPSPLSAAVTGAISMWKRVDRVRRVWRAGSGWNLAWASKRCCKGSLRLWDWLSSSCIWTRSWPGIFVGPRNHLPVNGSYNHIANRSSARYVISFGVMNMLLAMSVCVSMYVVAALDFGIGLWIIDCKLFEERRAAKMHRKLSPVLSA